MRSNITNTELSSATSSVMEALTIIKGEGAEHDDHGMKKDITPAELRDATVAIQKAMAIIQADGEEESESDKKKRRELTERSRLEAVHKHNLLNERRITSKSYSEETLNSIAQNFTNFLKGKGVRLKTPVKVVDARNSGIPDDFFGDEMHEIFLFVSLEDSTQDHLIPEFFSNVQVRH